MAGRKGSKVFISYAHKDGAPLAQRLQRDLARKGFDVWLDTRRMGGGAKWTEEIERVLDKCETVLALLTPGSYVSDICRAEQLRGLRKGKRVIPLMAQGGSDVPLHLEARNYRDFSGAKTYTTQFRSLIEDIRKPRTGVRLREQFRVTYVTAPPLPRNYVERPDALAGLRKALITDGSGPSIALTALRGMGGIGKTILAQALCRDEVVQEAFPDGIIWVTAGKQPMHDLVTRFREVGKMLKDDLAGYDTELGCIHSYRTAMRKKAALIVIDDVWRSEDIEPFRTESPRSRLLFTTRDGSIAAAAGAEEYNAGLLTEEQSRALLARWSGSKPKELPPEAGELLHECGRLPLALAMIGAMLRGKPRTYWKHVHELLCSADLAKIKAQFPDYPHTDLLRAIQVSVDALEAEARDRYMALAVLLEDMPVPPAIQQLLWNAREGSALEMAEQLVSLSLAQRDTDEGAIRLHDLQLDYVRAQYADREALGVIHGAVRLSSHVIERDPSQFASQMVGRLLWYEEATIRRFTTSLTRAARGAWLRPLWPALHPPGTALLRTLKGHSAFVNAVAVSADGRRAVSVSSDRTLRVWDVETGRGLSTVEGHYDYILGVAASADGRRAISASSDKTLKVWDVETGQVLRRLIGHSAAVSSVAVTRDGRRAVSASGDKTLKVWDVETGRALCTLEGHSGGVSGVAVSADGRRAVSASEDKTLKVWDVESGRALRTLEGHSDRVRSVAVSADGRLAVSASADCTLKVWDVETGRAVATLEGHSNSVSGVAVSADGRRAVSASNDQMLKVWSLEARGGLRTREGHAASIEGVAVSGDRRRVVSASSDRTLKVWDLQTGCVLRTLEGHSHYVPGVAVTTDGRAISASWDKTLKVWDLQTGAQLRTLEGHSAAVFGVAVTRDGRRAVSASSEDTLKLWDLETGDVLRTLKGHILSVYSVAVSADGRRAVSASGDKTLKVWNLESGDVMHTLAGHAWSVCAIGMSADERLAISASWDKTLKVWDLQTGKAVRTLEGHSDKVNSVAVSAEGPHVVSASDDNTLKVWNVETGTTLATFSCDAAARCCAFVGPRRIVAGDAAGRLHFFAFELGDGE